MSDVTIECDTGLDEYANGKELHPDYREFECWNCGNTELVGPSRMMRVCHECFMGNEPTDHDTDSAVEGPDGDLYVDYRLLWYGDVSRQEAQQRYERKTKDVRERSQRHRAQERTVRL